MLFKLHYALMAAGANAILILLGVFMQTYTDGNSTEIGALLMMMPFLGIFVRPTICSIADRHQAHQKCLIYCLITVALSYFPFIIIPFLGPAFYVHHSRLCWWLLVTLKVIGDVAFGGASSIGDSLAINHAKRVGTQFGTYRVWGTISWMFFGFVTGQVNEVAFLPKYVPGFVILCVASLVDAFVCWLWPAEFFKMVAMNPGEEISAKNLQLQKDNRVKLMSEEEVSAHMKAKLKSLVSCWRSEAKVKSTRPTASAVESTKSTDVNPPTGATCQQQVDKRTQLLMLAMLFRKDPRLSLYLAFFVCAGATLIPMSFFYMSLSEICNQQGTCNFSQLAGFLQISMSVMEAILFTFIGHILTSTGRVNMCIVALALASFKYLFYGTVWINLNPHWALLIEPIHGMYFCCYSTLLVEMGHIFANEVEYILPQMIERGIVKSGANVDKVRLSLSATMQAVLSTAMEGLGCGCGALIYGILLAHYSYQWLWVMVGMFAGLACLATFAIKLLDCIFDPKLGLDVRARQPNEKTSHNQFGLNEAAQRGKLESCEC